MRTSSLRTRPYHFKSRQLDSYRLIERMSKTPLLIDSVHLNKEDNGTIVYQIHNVVLI